VAAFVSVTPGYFQAIGVRLKRGRLFTEQERTGTPLVCVVNEEMARRHFPNGEDPVGKRLEIGFSNPPNWRQIVGVVEDTKYGAVDQAPKVQVYGAYFQQPGVIPNLAPPVSIAIRTGMDPAALAQAARRKVLEVDNAQPVYAVQTMTEVVSANLAQRRFAMLLLGLFAGLALLLAAIGLAGVISYLVTQRTKEIGIRMAMGATRGALLRMIEGETLRLVGIGIAVGLAGAVAATRALETMLFGVTPRDPATFATVAAVLMLVALAAGMWPALRATRIDPVRALREE
jgi:putative ABC transport system permease protein